MAMKSTLCSTVCCTMILPLMIAILAWLVLIPFFDTDISTQQQSQQPPLDYGTGLMFDQIATKYDMINRILALRMDINWRKQMVRRVKDELINDNPIHTTTDYMIVDLATGTADVAIQIAKEFTNINTPTRIIGIDPSYRMLQVGEKKIKHLQLENQITLIQGNAIDLLSQQTLEPSSIDAITMAFGIRNVPQESRTRALCQMHQLLKPNTGILAILEFSEPQDDDKHGVLGWVAKYFIRYVVPTVGGMLSGKPTEYAHLQNSIQNFPTPNEFNRQLQSLQCPINSVDDDNDVETTVSTVVIGYFQMDDVIHMNFGSVQLYIGKAKTKTTILPQPKKKPFKDDDPVLPPIV